MVLRLGLGTTTLAIFIVDTLTSLNIAVAVLYVLVMMIAMDSFSAHGVRLLAFACGGLTFGAFLLSHVDDLFSSALARCLVSLLAIAIAAWLVKKSKRVNDRLQEQLRLLAQTHDAIIVCAMDNTIRSWNAGAEVLYGWKAHEVIGRNCWKLLCSRSSLSLEDIKAVLLVDGSWEGELLETTCDGKAVTVLTRWSLSRDHRGQPIAILASNNDISDARLAEEALHRSEEDLVHISRITMMGELESFDALLKAADTALNLAKRNGRNRHLMYAEDMGEAANKRLHLQVELRSALLNGELEVHYQPQIELVTGRVTGAEALLRWRHPQRGMVLPSEFIPEA
jgi:PAS domain S-box-containing protein